MDALSEAAIRARLPDDANDRIGVLEVVDSVASTNAELISAAPPKVGRWRVLIAREQRRGRGRSGGAWYSPADAGLYLSAATSFAEGTTVSGALTLATGVAVARALEALGVAGIRLKWPNDLVVDGAKLGGILVEMKSAGRTAVIGIGINFRPVDRRKLTGRHSLPPTALSDILDDAPARAEVAAAVLARVLAAVPAFLDGGLDAFREDYARYDWLRGKAVTIVDIDPAVSGIARGIGDDGSLAIDNESARFHVVSGTVRMAGGDA